MSKKQKTSRSLVSRYPRGVDDPLGAAALASPAVFAQGRGQPPPVFDQVSVSTNERLRQIHNVNMAGDLLRLQRDLSILELSTRNLIVLAERTDDFNTRTEPTEIRDLTVRFKNAVLAFLKRFSCVAYLRNASRFLARFSCFRSFPSSCWCCR
jgi:hypothetical protein